MANVYNKPIVVIGGGGAEIPVDNGMIYEGKYRIRYFDIDGTILKIEYVTNGGNLTPPNNPTYDPEYLIFDEWNYDIENYIVEQPTDVGAIYKTVDDATYLFIQLLTADTLEMKISGYTSIDWGDGTVDANNSHVYSNEGEYIIKINGDFSFQVGTSQYLFSTSAQMNYIKKVYIGTNTQSLGNRTFFSTASCKIVSLSKNLTTCPSEMLYASNVIHINIPKNMLNFPKSQQFANAHNLITYSLPANITIESTHGMFSYSGIKEFIIPYGVDEIKKNNISNCFPQKILYPKTINKIANEVWAYYATDIFILSQSVPVATVSTIFDGFKKGSAVIWVNDEIIEELKVATNWATYANNMRPLSWYPSLTNPNA